MIRALTSDETASPEFRHLLWLAVEVDDAQLNAIARDVLPKLTVHGVVKDDRVVAFVAFDAGTDPMAIEYIAVDEREQGRGHGTALIDAVRSHANGRSVYAQTDDDAVEFYRRAGFAVEPAEPDPRWPDRQRYDCLLA